MISFEGIPDFSHLHQHDFILKKDKLVYPRKYNPSVISDYTYQKRFKINSTCEYTKDTDSVINYPRRLPIFMFFCEDVATHYNYLEYFDIRITYTDA